MYETIIIFIIVGFIAQIIDGALGMAYGVSSTTVLLSMGISPSTASASVHTAECHKRRVWALTPKAWKCRQKVTLEASYSRARAINIKKP